MSVAELLQSRVGLRITDPRQTSVAVHKYLRDLIIAGVLPPGVELKQAELARILAVSRTPMREAFRMLQEEHLVSGEPNQRSRVLGLDADALESLYVARIALESLGAMLTAGRLTRVELRAANGEFREMDRAHRAGDMANWAVAHHRFHRLVACRCGAPVLRTISSYAAQSERYVRIDQSMRQDAFAARRAEHAGILDAVRDGAAREAVARMAEHLAGTARRVVEDIAPGRGTPAVDAVVALMAARSDLAVEPVPAPRSWSVS